MLFHDMHHSKHDVFHVLADSLCVLWKTTLLSFWGKWNRGIWTDFWKCKIVSSSLTLSTTCCLLSPSFSISLTHKTFITEMADERAALGKNEAKRDEEQKKERERESKRGRERWFSWGPIPLWLPCWSINMVFQRRH